MKRSEKHLLFAFILIASLALTGCEQPLPTGSVEPPTQPVVTEPIIVMTENPNSDVDPSVVCPTPSDERLLYLNVRAGYCFLYPDYFTAQVDTTQPGEIVQLIGPRQEPVPKMQELMGTFVYISLNGLPEGMDSQQYASRWLSLYAPEEEKEWESATIGGLPAVIVSDLPGFTPQKGAFIVTPEGRYTIFLSPQPEDFPELAEHASLVWETVVGTMVFFKPQLDLSATYIRAEDVCPQASTETILLTDLTKGYCSLYPADFDLDPSIPGRIVAGPVLDNREGFGLIRTSLAVGTLGYFPGQSPLIAVHERMETVDPNTVVETMIAGHEAVVFRGPNDPWTHRQAFISVDGMIYTLVAQPEEPERYPQGMEYLERMWNMVVDTLAFFTPWR
jgi:hypothetical protein